MIITGLSTLFAGVSLAQPQAAAILPAGDIPLARLVDLSADLAEVSIEYDATLLRGNATLRLAKELEGDQLWALTNELLAARGLTTLRRGTDSPLLSVVKLQDAARLAVADADFASLYAPIPGFVSVGLSLEHMAPDDFLAEIEPMLSSSGGEASRTPEPGVIRIADRTPVVRRVVELAAVLDTPDAVSSMEFVGVDSLAPAELIQLVGTIRGGSTAGGGEQGGRLFEGPDGRSVIVVGTARERADLRSLVGRLDENARLETRLYTPSGFGTSAVADLIKSSFGEEPNGLEIVEDGLTSTLQVTAAPAQHERIAALLERLESVPPGARRPLRAFPVRNRDAEEIASLIRNLVDAGMFESGLAARGRLAGEPSAQAGAGSMSRNRSGEDGFGDASDEGVRIAVDRGTSRLLAIGEPRDLDRIGVLVEELDVRQPQVMLEVLMVSLSDGQSRDFGIELQRLLDDAGTIVGLTSLFGISDLGLSDGGSGVLGSGSGATAVVLDPGDFSVVIRALENISDGRALSMPRVLVNNNESGTINSTVEEPFLSTNASDTVATTSFGGSSAAGTQVNVTPQIAEGDHIVLQYSVSLSSFVGESADPALPPPRQQNTISSRATIPDGYTIVVGGIEIESEAEAETRVPLLGAIPGVGELFKSRSQSSSRSRFYAFIKPTVMRHESFDDLKHYGRPFLEEARVDDGLPELLPRVIR